MKQTPLEEKLTSLFSPIIEDLGYQLVLVSVSGKEGGRTLQVLAENPETRRLGVDECAKISREISATLDVEDPIKGAYRLEVSSPGISRPLVKPEDFEDYKGFEAKITINPPLDGQKRFRGRLEGIDEGAVALETDQGLVKLDYSAIETARLVLTDELIAATKTTNKQDNQEESEAR